MVSEFALTALLGLLLAFGASCTGGPPSERELRSLPPAPYKVLIVFSGPDRLERQLEPLWEEVAGRLESYGTFSLLEWLPSSDVIREAASNKIDEGSWLRRMAESEGYDRIAFVWIEPGEIEDLGPNWNAVASTSLWLALGIPGFFIEDRSYGNAYTVGAQVVDLRGDLRRPELETLAIPEVGLSFWDRGLTAWCLIVPPFLLEGEPEEWKSSAEADALDTLVRTLVHHFKSRPLPPTDVRIEYRQDHPDALSQSGAAAFRLLSELPLDRVELRVGGELYGQWDDVELEKRHELIDGVIQYSFELEVPLDEGSETALRISSYQGEVVHTGTLLLRKEKGQ